MPLATLVMITVALIIVYFAFIKEKPKKEVEQKIDAKVSDYEEKVRLAEKIDKIDPVKRSEAEEKINNILSEDNKKQEEKTIQENKKEEN